MGIASEHLLSQGSGPDVDVTPFRRSVSTYFRDPLAVASLLFLVFVALGAIIGPWLSPYTYYAVDLAHANTSPSGAHWFGTDDLGRDLFTRVWYGARISLSVGLAAAFVDLVVGVLYGGIAALADGILDETMMRFADILYSLPYLLIVILFTVTLGSGLVPIVIAITFIGWINMARIVRGQVLQLKTQEYVLAAKVLGAGFFRILFTHLLPNTMGPIWVTLTLTIRSAIFVEAFLSFLGLGVQAPIASWGSMASDGLNALQYYPWRLFIPATFISMTILALNIVSDALRDVTDPKTVTR